MRPHLAGAPSLLMSDRDDALLGFDALPSFPDGCACESFAVHGLVGIPCQLMSLVFAHRKQYVAAHLMTCSAYVTVSSLLSHDMTA